MNPEEYHIMYEAEESHWWYIGMRKVFLSILDRYYPPAKAGPPSLLVLDAGCGTGAMLSRLGRYGRVYGFDLAEEAISYCRLRGFDGRQLVHASITSIPFADDAFDLVVSFDVLYSIVEEDKALKDLYRVVRPGGRLLLNLPAFNILRSEHDEAVSTVRRYTRGQVRELLGRAGFQVEKLTYVNTILFPFAATYRLAKKLWLRDDRKVRSDLGPLPSWLNSALVWPLSLEAGILRWANLPFGLSVLSLARKPGTV